MKKRIFTISAFLCVFLIWGCYPEELQNIEDLDIVVTNYNDTYDFAGKQTYAMPDSIVKITGTLAWLDDPLFIPNDTTSMILAQIEDNMADFGWQRVSLESEPAPDLILVPASWQTTTAYYYTFDYWYWYWGVYYSVISKKVPGNE